MATWAVLALRAALYYDLYYGGDSVSFDVFLPYAHPMEGTAHWVSTEKAPYIRTFYHYAFLSYQGECLSGSYGESSV